MTHHCEEHKGHDRHNHEHHHHHSHGHHHTPDKNGFSVYDHDGATVASGILTFAFDYQAAVTHINTQLKMLAEWVEKEGGIIGHIKAYVKRCDATAFLSITDVDEEVSVVEKRTERVEITLTAIVYMIGPEHLEARLSEIILQFH